MRFLMMWLSCMLVFPVFSQNPQLTRLHFFDRNGSAMEFVSPSAVHQYKNSWVVLDTTVGVFQFDKDRKLVKKLYGIGQGPTELTSRTSFMALAGHQLVIPDTFYGRLQIYDLETRKYATVKTPTMTFVTNATVVGHSVYIGGEGYFYKFTDGKIERTKLPAASGLPEVLLVANRGGLCGLSMFLYGNHCDEIHTWKMNGPDLKRTITNIPSTAKLEKWKKKARMPLFFISVAPGPHGLLATSRLSDDETGSRIYVFKDDGSVKTIQIKGVQDAIFSASKDKIYLIDNFEGAIYTFAFKN
jgi:hypothetical protein